MSLPESISAHIGVVVFGLLCDVMIISGVYSKVRFSTNINLALANCKGVISFVRLGLLILHLIIAQVRFKLSSSGPGPGPRSGPGQVPGQVQKVQGLRTKDLDLG